jgi:hypothetical protein
MGDVEVPVPVCASRHLCSSDMRKWRGRLSGRGVSGEAGVSFFHPDR